MSDKEILVSNAAESEKALYLWQRHRRLIQIVCKKFVGAIESDDLMQEAYFGTLNAIRAYQKTGSRYEFTTILFNALKWNFLRLAKEQEKKGVLVLDAPLGSDSDSATLLDLVPDEAAGPEQKALDKAICGPVRKEYQKACERLTEAEKTVSDLYFLEGKTSGEISKEVQKSTQEVQRTYCRVVRKLFSNYKLRQCLKDYAEGCEPFYSEGLRFTGWKSFKERCASSQEMYLLNRENKK